MANLLTGLKLEDEMFNAKALVVNGLTVVGKLLTLLVVSSSVYASELTNPRFYDYRGGPAINEIIQTTFGWFRTLDDEQKASYSQAITHALMVAENGQVVEWYKSDASGIAVPVMTWPSSSGYCRRLHIQTIAYNIEKTISRTACYSNASRNWQWYRE